MENKNENSICIIKQNIDNVILNVDIANEQNAEVSDQVNQLMKECIEISLAYEDYAGNYEVDISLVDDQRIQSLNNEFRGKDSVTDVLSFPQWEEVPKISEDYPIHIGDIVINVARAIEQSENYGHSLKRELIFLTVHSVFHLLGYDHEVEEERKIMRNKEETVLNYLDILREK